MASSNGIKLRFRMVFHSSEEYDFPAEELNTHSPQSKGWISSKFCSYPQELGFEILPPSSSAQELPTVSKIEFLSHQSKIASKIEVFVGTGEGYDSCTFKRLGYLSLDKNEKSNYQARELKSVFVDNMPCQFVKFLVHKNYVNKLNHFNQVGIIAVNFHGSTTDASDIVLKRPLPSPHSKQTVVGSPKMKPFAGESDLSTEVNLDPFVALKLREVVTLKQQSIEEEDYEMAKVAKAMEQQLKSCGVRLARLDINKRQAVKDEDFDRASELKHQIDILKAQVEEMLAPLGLSQRGRLAAVPSQRGEEAQPIPQRMLSRQAEYDLTEEQHMASYSSPRQPAVNRGNIANTPVSSEKRMPSEKESMYEVESDLGSGPRSMSAMKSTPRRGSGRAQDEEVDNRLTVVSASELQISPRNPRMDGVSPQPKKLVLNYLASVPNVENLPDPEDLAASSREEAEGLGLISLLGEYRVKCLFSKVWGLREAATIKTQLLVDSEFQSSRALPELLSALVAVVKIGIDDKIQQVMFSSIHLLEVVLAAATRHRISRQVCISQFEPILTLLIDKLADGNTRIRDSAKRGVDIITAAPCVGVNFVGSHALRPLAPKHRTAWRPLVARLQLITDLLNTFGMGQLSGLATDPVMQFVKVNGAFSHSNNEVREAARDVTVAVYRHVGIAPLESYLNAGLRKKQRIEYDVAFAAATGATLGGIAQTNANSAPKSNGTSSQSRPQRPQKTTDDVQEKNETKAIRGQKQSTSDPNETHQHSQHSQHPHHNHVAQTHGLVATSSSQPHRAGADPADDQDHRTHSCSFCGAGSHPGEQWTEEDVDAHYLQDCPMLASCPACAQVLEIAAIPDHLLDECEFKDDYLPCDVTGLAIRTDEFDSWQSSDRCVPPPDNKFYCPLCIEAVDDNNDAWTEHLSFMCTENTRLAPIEEEN